MQKGLRGQGPIGPFDQQKETEGLEQAQTAESAENQSADANNFCCTTTYRMVLSSWLFSRFGR